MLVRRYFSQILEFTNTWEITLGKIEVEDRQSGFFTPVSGVKK
jgi:hypothetical protein